MAPRLAPALFFFFDDTAPPEIFPLSLPDALPISSSIWEQRILKPLCGASKPVQTLRMDRLDRKSTRLNSSHVEISYAVFCFKKEPTYNAPCLSLSTAAVTSVPVPGYTYP